MSRRRLGGSADLTLIAGGLFASGGTVAVQPGGDQPYRPITRYLIGRTNNGVSTQFAGVTSSAVSFNPSLQYDARNVYLTLRRNDFDFRDRDTSGNETEIAAVINELIETATGPLADSINSLFELDDTRARHAFRSMGGILYQHMARSGLASAQTFTGIGMKRLGLVDGAESAILDPDGSTPIGSGGTASFVGANPLGAARTRGVWMTGLGGQAQYGGNAVDAGARVPMVGFALGYDTTIGEHVTIGASGGKADPEVFLDEAEDRGRSRTVQFGAYGRVAGAGSRLDGAIGYGTSSNKAWRFVTDGTGPLPTFAEFDGRTVAAQIEYGYGFDLGRRVQLEPQAAFQYRRLSLDGVTETGAGVLSLVVPERRVNSKRLLTGTRVIKSGGGVDGGWTLEGRASWAHEFSPLTPLHLRFVGDTVTDGFDLAAPNRERDSAVFGFTVAGRRVKGFRFFGSVDGEVDGPMPGWSGNVGVSRSW